MSPLSQHPEACAVGLAPGLVAEAPAQCPEAARLGTRMGSRQESDGIMGWPLALRARDLHCIREGREWGSSFDGQVAVSLPPPSSSL